MSIDFSKPGWASSFAMTAVTIQPTPGRPECRLLISGVLIETYPSLATAQAAQGRIQAGLIVASQQVAAAARDRCLGELRGVKSINLDGERMKGEIETAIRRFV